jgi:hypothetical protein
MPGVEPVYPKLIGFCEDIPLRAGLAHAHHAALPARRRQDIDPPKRGGREIFSLRQQGNSFFLVADFGPSGKNPPPERT